MIKKTVTYRDFNDREVTEDLYFHAPTNVLLDNLDLEDEFEALGHRLTGDKRELTLKEKRDILGLVKRLISISYGKRSEDGTKFYQGPEVLREFQASAAYDAFLWAIFTNQQGALEFMTGIFPQDLAERAAQVQAANQPRQPQDRLPKQQASKEPTVSGNEQVEFSGDVAETESAEEKRKRLEKELAELG